MAQRHNGVRNLVISFLGKVCTNVKVEPQLQPLDNEQFSLRSKVTSPEESRKSRKRRKSGSTNRGCCTLKWDLSLPQFLEPTVGWELTAIAFSNA